VGQGQAAERCQPHSLRMMGVGTEHRPPADIDQIATTETKSRKDEKGLAPAHDAS
jgi:hypothetical protein